MQHAMFTAGTELFGMFAIAASAIGSSALAAIVLLMHHGSGVAIPALTGGAASLIYDRVAGKRTRP